MELLDTLVAHFVPLRAREMGTIPTPPPFKMKQGTEWLNYLPKSAQLRLVQDFSRFHTLLITKS